MYPKNSFLLMFSFINYPISIELFSHITCQSWHGFGKENKQLNEKVLFLFIMSCRIKFLKRVFCLSFLWIFAISLTDFFVITVQTEIQRFLFLGAVATMFPKTFVGEPVCPICFRSQIEHTQSLAHNSIISFSLADIIPVMVGRRYSFISLVTARSAGSFT